MRTRTCFILLALILPSTALAHTGGIDGRGGHHCWTNCKKHSLYDGQYHFHPEKMNNNQLRVYTNFKDRLCERVVRRFSTNEKMWNRVNGRVERRFGFVCMK